MTNTHTPGDAPDRFDDDLDALASLLDEAGIEAEAAGIPRRAPGTPVPASFAQELLWMLDRATPGLTAYNLTISRRIRGALSVDALERALTLLAARHESLRARFAEGDGAPRLVVDEPGPVALRVVDLAALPDDEREREAERVARDRARTPFDLAREHLFRPTLIRLAADDHVLLLESHHIVLDGWSMGILFRELAEAYGAFAAGREPQLAALPIQFGDFARWQRDQLAGERLERLLAFWRAQLGGAGEPLALPTDRARQQVPTFAGARRTLVLGAADAAAVRGLAQRHGATLYMVLLAGYAAVLHRYTGRATVLVGSGSAGRTLRETESLVGYLNNTLVQRADFAGDPTFAELLAQVKRSALDAYDHQEVPLEKLVLELREGSDRLADAPLFEVVLTMQETMGGDVALAGLRVEPFGADAAATKFDLTLLVTERAEEIVLTAQYRSDLFEPPTVERFLGHLRHALVAAAATPETRVSALPLLTTAERVALDEFNATRVDEGRAESLVALFEAQAARVPSRDAVVAPDATLTFAELDARANAVAARLRATGVAPGGAVGLLADRSANAIVGLLGILKAGAAFVPVASDAPAARVARQLAECRATAAVVDAPLAHLAPAGRVAVALDDAAGAVANAPADAPLESVSPDAVAYVLYTSGSTGTPKGVAVTHANAVHYARAVSRVLADVPEAQPGDGFAALDGLHFGLVSTLAADLGYTSVLPALLAGGTLHVVSREAGTEPARWAELAAARPLDVLKLTPSHLAALTAGRTGHDLAALLPRKWLVLGGEALRPDVARALLAAGGPRVLNHYGPTEATVGACTFEVTPDSLGSATAAGAGTVPVGLPLANTRAWVLDAHGTEQPLGVPGELSLGGAGVARGYLGRDDLTAERFAMVRGERAYRTGDRARRLASGAVEFLGRADDQVKVRGYRVELGEIEQALRAHPAVAEAAVVVRAGEGEPALAAFVVPRAAGYAASHAERPTPERLAEHLGAELPPYMVPATIAVLDALPLTPNGKVDRQALAAAPAAGAPARAAVEPRTDTERGLVAIWRDVLKRDTVGVTDSFLELGGHSLLAIRVLGRISKQFGVRLALRTLFDAPTVEQLAAVVERERAAAAPAAASIKPVSRDAFRVARPAPAGTEGPGGVS